MGRVLALLPLSSHKTLPQGRDIAVELTEQDFSFLCQYVHQQAGIVLGENKREMVYRRLTRIIRERQLPSFSAYCQLLRQQPEQEKSYFINAITTNLTSFFREPHHFDYLRDYELPRLIADPQQGQRLRLWSSASSTGEEPYSLAITLHEALKAQPRIWDAKILATDIDSNVLAHGKRGIYELRRVDGIDERYRQQYFKRGIDQYKDQVKVSAELQQYIIFKQLNLLSQWPMKGPFDVIFCRNVIIYFDKKTQLALFERYYRMLKPAGLLFLGHSENLGSFQRYFDSVGRTIFRKKG